MTATTEFKYPLNFTQKDIIAGGFHAIVFEINQHWVGRWSTDPRDGFIPIFDINSAILERLSLPRFDRVLSRPDENFFVVERLYKIDPLLFIGTDKAHAKMNQLWMLDKKKFILSQYLSPVHPLYEITKKIYTAYRYLRMKKILVSIDIAPSNIMMRKDGTLIASDPFSNVVLDMRMYLE